MNIELNGAKILFTLPFQLPGLGQLVISETLVMSWVVLAIITALCIWLGHDLKVENISKRQAAAEMIVESLNNFVHGNMGPTGFDTYIPLVGALFATSVVSNLISLLGVWSPTADLSTEAAWAVVVFVLITRNKLRAQGPVGYLKGYLSPIFIMAPINVISEIATPVSMACRHFGNILSGMVISSLIYAALALASYALLSALGANVIGALVVAALGAGLWYMNSSHAKISKEMREQGQEPPAKSGKMPGKIVGVILLAIGVLGLLSNLPGVGALFAGIPWLDFGLPGVLSLYFDWFSGCIQAFIFCTLTTIFIRNATEA